MFGEMNRHLNGADNHDAIIATKGENMTRCISGDNDVANVYVTTERNTSNIYS